MLSESNLVQLLVVSQSRNNQERK